VTPPPKPTEELERKIKALGDKAHRGRGGRQQGSPTCSAWWTALSRPSAGSTSWSTNAGIETRTSVLDSTEEQYQQVLDINLKSAFLRHPGGGEADDRTGRRVAGSST